MHCNFSIFSNKVAGWASPRVIFKKNILDFLITCLVVNFTQPNSSKRQVIFGMSILCPKVIFDISVYSNHPWHSKFIKLLFQCWIFTCFSYHFAVHVISLLTLGLIFFPGVLDEIFIDRYWYLARVPGVIEGLLLL